ncbi:MAG: type II toxin-antitoxin system RelE/ParE family toxin [Dehalococcoidales bacterium]|nr:type II toxin-antitoxin system RelE/ParE family toxin [Dehalococcoidales bacterium]
MFRIALSKEALKYYNKVGNNTAARLDKSFVALETDPLQNSNSKLLKGVAETYRFRTGNLRIIYQVDITEKVVYILAILPRGQAYK